MNKNILIVDDNDRFRLALKYRLENAKKGYSIIEEKYAKKGIEQIKKNENLQVILLDLHMPILSGQDTLKKLQGIIENLRIIVITGVPEEFDPTNAKNLGVFSFLTKPIKEEPLIFAVESAFNDLRRKELEKTIKSIKSIGKPLLKNNLELEKVFDLILVEALRWTDAEYGAILTYNGINKDLIIRASRIENTVYEKDIGSYVPIEKSISGKAFLTLKPLIVPTVNDEALYYRTLPNMHSEVAVPLIIDQKCIGVLDLESSQRNHFLNIDLDLLELLAAEASMLIQKANFKDELIKKENAAKLGEVSTQLTHSLGSIVGLINLRAQLLKEKLLKLGINDYKIFQEDIEEILIQSKRATDTKTRILRCYKKSDKLQNIDLANILSEIVIEKKNEFASKKINTIIDFHNKKIRIFGFSELIKIAFIELINNSIESIQNGGTITIRSRLGYDQNYNIVEISDTGKGISPNEIPHLFTPFFTRNDSENSTGVGLWNSREILARFGGTVELKETKIGKGTTFVLALPLS